MTRTKKIGRGFGLKFYNILADCKKETTKEKIIKLKNERNTYIQRIQNIDREIETLCNETETN